MVMVMMMMIMMEKKGAKGRQAMSWLEGQATMGALDDDIKRKAHRIGAGEDMRGVRLRVLKEQYGNDLVAGKRDTQQFLSHGIVACKKGATAKSATVQTMMVWKQEGDGQRCFAEKKTSAMMRI